MYKLTKEVNGVTKTIIWQKNETHMSIPTDEANTDYQAYLAWLEEGNIPLPADGE
jgi:hypothetical protein